jgi:hypothetical protein
MRRLFGHARAHAHAHDRARVVPVIDLNRYDPAAGVNRRAYVLSRDGI